jgi:hypothetical protein
MPGHRRNESVPVTHFRTTSKTSYLSIIQELGAQQNHHPEHAETLATEKTNPNVRAPQPVDPELSDLGPNLPREDSQESPDTSP